MMLAPAMRAGVFAGRHITLRLTRARSVRVINVMLPFSGIVVLGRYLTHGAFPRRER
jgi:hypothetical protein